MEIVASGCVTKNCEDFELVNAIVEVHQGNTFVSESMVQELKKNKESKLEEEIQISPRELEVLNHIVEEWSTVNTHRYHLMKKLNAKKSADLVRIAFSENLINQN